MSGHRRMRVALATALLAAIIGMAMIGAGTARATAKTYVYAASSLTGAIRLLADQFGATTGYSVTPVIGASSTLARQIRQGAPAHMYISAHADWIGWLDQHQLLEPAGRQTIATNQLVLATGGADTRPLSLTNAEAVVMRLAGGRLAMADPAHVPAGIYGKQALQSLDLWPALHDKLALAANVRIAVAYVARRETPLGLLYASDLTASPSLSRIATFPADSHDPVRYSIATIRGKSTQITQAFNRFLQSAKARAILTQFGFMAP